ncbi:hypothetical protein [Flavobacterium sp. N2038]|uniref:hypothetical protein n=1 Tax=Flavobacterium sp. N2038 TaxID=2986829 RepID=UPI002224406F|nr:hypothetical protein [Flavobacterium sp. N2038]
MEKNNHLFGIIRFSQRNSQNSQRVIYLSVFALMTFLLMSSCDRDPIENKVAEQENVLIDKNNRYQEDSEEVQKIKREYLDSITLLRDKNNVALFSKSTNNIEDFVNETRQLIISAKPNVNNLSQQIKDKYAYVLDGLISQGTGSYTSGTDKTDLYKNNALKNIRLPETIYWETRKDNTYHSYDIIRNLGPETNYMTLERAKNVLLNSYSYPGYKLGSVSNAINGGTRLVFGSLKNANNADTFTVPGGIIEQQAVLDGILNITTTEHTFYKGTIRKVVFKYKNNLFVATHGEGINRFCNFPDNIFNKALFNNFSKMNDTEGPISFITLDEQFFAALYK